MTISIVEQSGFLDHFLLFHGTARAKLLLVRLMVVRDLIMK